MSLPPRILCRSGCGDFGDPELDFLCVDCHGDRLETQQQRELQEYIRKKNQGATATAQAEHATSGRGNAENGAEASSPTRRGPPSINHQQGAPSLEPSIVLIADLLNPTDSVESLATKP